MNLESTEPQVGKLAATRRALTGKGVARKLRKDGKIPAVLYGEGGPAESLTIDPDGLLKSLDPAKKGNTLITLSITGDDGTVEQRVMLKDYQSDPLKGDLLHADFVRIHDDTIVFRDIPLVLTGRPVGIQEGGKLSQIFRKLAVECLAKAIPSLIEVDVAHLELGMTLSISELVAPEGVKILLPAHQTIATVLVPRGIIEEEEEAEGEEGAEGAEGAEGEAPAADGAAPADAPAGKRG